MNLFQININKKISPVLMNDQKAKTSIKNIEKHISQNKILLPKPIKEYKNLNIQNGGMSTEEAVQRAFKLIGNREWVIQK